MKDVMLEFDTIYTEKNFEISQIFLYNHDQSLSMFPSILSKMEVIILKVQILFCQRSVMFMKYLHKVHKRQ
jgi:hypothetical protein